MYYDRRAPLHDDYLGYASGPKNEQLVAPLIRIFEDRVSHKKVLEVACGTGIWTRILASRARSVLATDINPSVLDIARVKCCEADTVTFRTADAYRLKGIRGPYETAFAADWWSHIPKSRLPVFLNALHRKLKPGSSVVFVDMLPNRDLHRMFSHYDEEGNLIQRRLLPDGQQFHVVKNFPTRQELFESLAGQAQDIEYHEHHALNRWVLIYRTV
ncbi:MAG: class I SAM-dependent methyltransferase [Candidatus Zixiibacteriota bacterium]|nr:MAG: class I SAM-dependent methyltransferase [candidate division Zixibacteria bacterium]